MAFLHGFLQSILSSALSCSTVARRFFLTSCKTKGSLQQTVENDLPALVKLTFYENLLIGLETGVHCPHKWVLSRFPYSGVPLYLADDSRCKLACDTL